ncbi:hypothetical protein JTB14_004100 [Gonioctena quinquepunctata]|nr:hypothetical protein JTB14_004100 [Gonioctena quinquepunctata]
MKRPLMDGELFQLIESWLSNIEFISDEDDYWGVEIPGHTLPNVMKAKKEQANKMKPPLLNTPSNPASLSGTLSPCGTPSTSRWDPEVRPVFASSC